MIKQNVYIVNFNSLYEILEEIKENLPFNILNNENERIADNQEKVDLKDSLIITSSDKKNLDKGNLLIFDSLPISLSKLIELINISLIKLKYNYQSNINIKSYELNLNSKFFSKDSINLKLTEKEIEIILYLNVHKKKKMYWIYKKIYGGI